MRSILEKAFVALLNEEQDKAEELFHKFMVERARQIHESYRNGDEFDMDECWEEEIREETHFSEDDLSDLEDGDMEDGEESHVEGDIDNDGDLDEPGEEDYDTDEVGDDTDEDGDDTDEELSDDERMDHLEDQLEKLTAEFEAMMDAIGDEDEGDTDGSEEELGDIEDMSGDEIEDFGGEDDMETPPEDDMEDGDEDHMEESEDMDEDMDDLTESIIDELEKVKVSLEDGKEIGTGSKINQNRGAAIPQKNKEARMGGEPIKMKSAEHKGYARETAPATKEMPKRKNTRSTATVGMDKVSKEGNKSAEINKLSSESGNTNSPLQGTKNVVK